jgi:hypothetical protein
MTDAQWLSSTCSIATLGLPSLPSRRAIQCSHKHDAGSLIPELFLLRDQIGLPFNLLLPGFIDWFCLFSALVARFSIFSAQSVPDFTSHAGDLRHIGCHLCLHINK